uniref:Movement protein TGBp3 n=1 Tax=Carya illinoinensis carlavirus 1 TaxID=2794420 RepID=A0A7T5UFV6_9VIRU|nr:TGB3 [Carya illinoinensis carlavirus 1]
MLLYLLLGFVVCLTALFFQYYFSVPHECVVVVTGESFRAINCVVNRDLIEFTRVIKPKAWDCL